MVGGDEGVPGDSILTGYRVGSNGGIVFGF